MIEEIVAFRFGSTITNRVDIIRCLLETGQPYELLNRKRMQLMSNCDLGPRWDNLAASPTLFCVERNNDGEIVRLIPATKEREGWMLNI